MLKQASFGQRSKGDSSMPSAQGHRLSQQPGMHHQGGSCANFIRKFFNTIYFLNPWSSQEKTCMLIYRRKWRGHQFHNCYRIQPREPPGFWSAAFSNSSCFRIFLVFQYALFPAFSTLLALIFSLFSICPSSPTGKRLK